MGKLRGAGEGENIIKLYCMKIIYFQFEKASNKVRWHVYYMKPKQLEKSKLIFFYFFFLRVKNVGQSPHIEHEIAQKEINPRLFGVSVCVPICLCACSIYTYL